MTRRVRVLYLIDTLEIGGTEKSLLSTLPRYRRTECMVAHLFAGDRLRRDFEANGIPIRSLVTDGRLSPVRTLGMILDVIGAYQPDIIHSSLFRANQYARMAGRMTGIPVVNSLVNDSYATIRYSRMDKRAARKLRVVQAIDRLTAPMVTGFVANTVAIADANSCTIRIPRHKIAVFYRGRDIGGFSESSAVDRQRVRVELGLGDGDRLLLNVARLETAKNQLELIESMRFVVQQEPTCRLMIAGEGTQRGELERAVHERGLCRHVRLLGNRADIGQLLQVADVFVFPSLYEGHPGALVEAMLASRPIVASDTAVHRETLLGGAVGLLSPIGVPEVFAQRVVSLLRDPVYGRNLGACARASAVQRFDIEMIAAQHETLYHEMVSALGTL